MTISLNLLRFDVFGVGAMGDDLAPFASVPDLNCRKCQRSAHLDCVALYLEQVAFSSGRHICSMYVR